LSTSADGLFVNDKIAALDALQVCCLQIVALAVGLTAERKVKLVKRRRAAKTKTRQKQ